ncbi:MAG: DUF6702 family protein [Bacteroidota bacterium]
MIFKVCSLVFSMTLLSFHPFHISVTDIEYDAEAKSVEIAQKIFMDDLEEVLVPEEDRLVDLISKDQKAKNDLLIKAYLTKNFTIVINGKPADYQFLGTQVEGDAIWCFMEVPKTRKFKSISVRNTVLMDRFDDQLNLVHVKHEEKIRSMRLHKSESSKEFVYD